MKQPILDAPTEIKDYSRRHEQTENMDVSRSTISRQIHFRTAIVVVNLLLFSLLKQPIFDVPYETVKRRNVKRNKQEQEQEQPQLQQQQQQQQQQQHEHQHHAIIPHVNQQINQPNAIIPKINNEQTIQQPIQQTIQQPIQQTIQQPIQHTIQQTIQQINTQQTIIQHGPHQIINYQQQIIQQQQQQIIANPSLEPRTLYAGESFSLYRTAYIYNSDNESSDSPDWDSESERSVLYDQRHYREPLTLRRRDSHVAQSIASSRDITLRRDLY